MKRIPLSKGLFATVDDCDYAFLRQWNWWANAARRTFYAQRQTSREDGRQNVYMHKVVGARMRLPPGRVDHTDGNGLNNCRANLRSATQSQNGMNRRKQGNKSGYKGVSRATNSNRWQARIRVNRKATHIGTFDTRIEAARAYDEAALVLHGEFARLNFPGAKRK